jgi:hypothetical protein
MNPSQLYSWIFLATGLASKIQTASFSEISLIADGINHAVPTHKQMQTATNWLIKKGFLLKEGARYRLTTAGEAELSHAAMNSNVLLSIWKILETRISALNK